MYKVRDVKSKVKLLYNIYFLSSLKIDLIDIEEYKYSQRILQQKEIKEREILKVISYIEKDKISKLDEISNKVIQILI